MSGTPNGIKPVAPAPGATVEKKKGKRVFKPKNTTELMGWYLGALIVGAIFGYLGGMTIPVVNIVIPYIGGPMIGAGAAMCFILIVHYADLLSAYGP